MHTYIYSFVLLLTLVRETSFYSELQLIQRPRTSQVLRMKNTEFLAVAWLFIETFHHPKSREL